MIHNALASARDVANKVTANIRDGNVLTDDELLTRYVAMHRGNPLGTAQFVMGNRERMPEGQDMLGAMRSYEKRMEELLKARGM